MNSEVIKETKSYDTFKLLEGNRSLDAKHIKKLQKLLLTNGNLTQRFPIVVNERMEVIDGQHRLRALQELGWSVFYVVQDNLTLSDVRAINIGHRNWSWKDYATSYAELGNKNYERILKLHEEFGFSFHILMQYIGHGFGGGIESVSGQRTLSYRQGELILSEEQYQKARILLTQLEECVEAAELNIRGFTSALYQVMRSPDYDHARMVKKLNQVGPSMLRRARSVEDFLRALEEVYNFHMGEENKVRLF